MSLIIVYTGFNLPFVVWMMRGFFADLPRDLEEAALVDGDSRLGALVRIVLPLVAPGLAATAVFCLIVSWNEFLFALVLTQTDAAMTLPVGIAGRVTQFEIKWGVMSAAATVAVVPILVFALSYRSISSGDYRWVQSKDRCLSQESRLRTWETRQRERWGSSSKM